MLTRFCQSSKANLVMSCIYYSSHWSEKKVEETILQSGLKVNERWPVTISYLFTLVCRRRRPYGLCVTIPVGAETGDV